LAGKFEQICSAFPLTTFFEKNLKKLPIKVFHRKNFSNGTVDRKSRKNYCTTSRWKINFDISSLFFQSNKFLPNILQISFSNELRDGFCTMWCKSSSRNEKDEMAKWSNSRQNKIQFQNGFLNLAKWPWNSVSTNWV